MRVPLLLLGLVGCGSNDLPPRPGPAALAERDPVAEAVARARRLVAELRCREASQVLEEVLALRPDHPEARALRLRVDLMGGCTPIREWNGQARVPPSRSDTVLALCLARLDEAAAHMAVGARAEAGALCEQVHETLRWYPFPFGRVTPDPRPTLRRRLEEVWPPP